MLKLADGVILKRIDEGAIIADGNQGSYLVLNRSATEILEALLAADKEPAMDKLLQVFDVERTRLGDDVQRFISRLAELGLVSE